MLLWKIIHGVFEFAMPIGYILGVRLRKDRFFIYYVFMHIHGDPKDFIFIKQKLNFSAGF